MKILAPIDETKDIVDKEYVDTQVATKVTGTTKITVGTTPPSSPSIGDIWIDTN